MPIIGGFRHSRTTAYSLCAVAMACSISGCAGDRVPPRPFRFNRDKPYASTLGQDLRAAPPGITIPPPSLGIDLVRSRPGPAGLESSDPEVHTTRLVRDLTGSSPSITNR